LDITAQWPVGDFNNDSKLDLAVGLPTEIQLYLGNGDGSFKAPINTKSSQTIRGLYVGDFNNDGKLDILAFVNEGNEAVIFLGKGDGTFVKKSSFSDGIQPPSYARFADLNGDGNLDICVTGGSHEGGGIVEVYLGKGNGTFERFWGGGTNNYPGIPAIGDFNGDGKLDLAVPDGPTVDIYLGNGDGTFQNPVFYSPTYGAGSVIVAADVNGDGKLDLMTGGGSVLLGNGDGTFRDDGGISTGFSGADLYLGDFNGDGILDLAGLSPRSLDVTIFLGNGDGTFQSALDFAGDGTGGPRIGVGDFNGDGKLDVVTIGTVNNVPVRSLFMQSGINLSPQSLAFSDQDVGTTSPPQTTTLTNLNSSALPINGITIQGADSKDFAQTNNCGTSLPGNSSCQIQVTFTPKAAGSRTASLQVSYKGLGSPQSVSLSGTGVSAPTVSLTPSSLTYKTQLINTTSAPQTATLKNTGDQTVTISSISTTTPFSETNNCPATLNVGSSCQIQVTFTPTGPGPAQELLSVSDNAIGSPQTVKLTGTGTVVKFSPISVNFGDQQVNTSSNPVPIQLTNEWTTALSISQIQITGADAQDFSQKNNCGSSVPPGGYCTIMVTFTPTQKGQRSGQLSVSDNGGSPQTVPLAGTGT
jgi:FG-GAP-like repeat/Abnormal spindle-like microcephaly-assoc'd, ASPM-SPD-2-Hydin